MKKILIDCDPGIDDSLALILALKSDQVDLRAVTTVSGNLHVDDTSRNALTIMEMMGADSIPVAKGMAKPLVRDIPFDPFSHGKDGLGNTGLPQPKRSLAPVFGPDLIVEQANLYPGELTLIALGPLSNIAMALLKDPELPKKVKELVCIGGAFGFNEYAYKHATGDNPVSEWNVYVDPEAAKMVFNSGLSIRAVGLDVATHPDINFPQEQVDLLRQSSNQEAVYVSKLVDFVEGRGFQSYCVLIDSLAVAAVIDPSVIETTSVRVDVETAGTLTRGQTVCDTRNHFRWDHLPVIDAASGADFRKFSEIVTSALLK
ncbi:nucleoside hydrolase [Paenibacillus senegalensis]|uniref:nucleoside hydrolase n=1 Tax=Paenibacillus senegalensis TaxID=1465766 RepID=UPI000287B537|nr:nucleoside hydrolase [Paenibacillus senegalensis]